MNTKEIQLPKNLQEIAALDSDLMVTGYTDGLKGKPNQTQTDAAYWHGYGNGLVDSGRAPTDHIQTKIAAEFNAAMRQRTTAAVQ